MFLMSYDCTLEDNYMRPEMKSIRNEISIHHKRIFVYITFHCERNEIDFVSRVVRGKQPIK